MNLRSNARLVEFLEAVYAMERDDQEWLTLTLGALSSVCGPDLKYLGFFYDASNVEDLKLWNQVRLTDDVSPGVFWVWGTFLNVATPEFVNATFRSLLVGSARKNAFELAKPILEVRERHGDGDFLYFNALDPSGLGCVLTVGFPHQEFVRDASTVALFKRMALHLSAAYRCRRKLTRAGDEGLGSDDLAERAEAILDTNGRFLHADGPARSDASREQIRDAVRSIESARRKTGREGRLAVDGWHPLTAARWTLVDRFEEGGRRYILACENQLETKGFDFLTERERQIVVHAALGMTNKEIAYAMGLSHATVRVLMARAAKRLGVSGRDNLLAHPALRHLFSARVRGES